MFGLFRQLFRAKQTIKSSDADGRPVELQSMTLYYSPGCPFCMKVHWALLQKNIQLAKKDVVVTPGARQELVAGGGKSMVPCLRIHEPAGDRWLYESDDIIAFLERRASSERQMLGA